MPENRKFAQAVRHLRLLGACVVLNAGCARETRPEDRTAVQSEAAASSAAVTMLGSEPGAVGYPRGLDDARRVRLHVPERSVVTVPHGTTQPVPYYPSAREFTPAIPAGYTTSFRGQPTDTLRLLTGDAIYFWTETAGNLDDDEKKYRLMYSSPATRAGGIWNIAVPLGANACAAGCELSSVTNISTVGLVDLGVRRVYRHLVPVSRSVVKAIPGCTVAYHSIASFIIVDEDPAGIDPPFLHASSEIEVPDASSTKGSYEPVAIPSRLDANVVYALLRINNRCEAEGITAAVGQMMYAASYDAGKTFGAPRSLVTEAGDYFYSASAPANTIYEPSSGRYIVTANTTPSNPAGNHSRANVGVFFVTEKRPGDLRVDEDSAMNLQAWDPLIDPPFDATSYDPLHVQRTNVELFSAPDGRVYSGYYRYIYEALKQVPTEGAYEWFRVTTAVEGASADLVLADLFRSRVSVTVTAPVGTSAVTLYRRAAGTNAHWERVGSWSSPASIPAISGYLEGTVYEFYAVIGRPDDGGSVHYEATNPLVVRIPDQPPQLTITGAGPGTVDWTWAAEEREVYLYRRQRYADGSTGSWDTVATFGPERSTARNPGHVAGTYEFVISARRYRPEEWVSSNMVIYTIP